MKEHILSYSVNLLLGINPNEMVWDEFNHRVKSKKPISGQHTV